MRIGFVIPYFSPRAGGSAAVAYNLARQLVKKGHEVTVFTSDKYRDVAGFPDELDLRIHESKCVLSLSGFYYSPGFAHPLQENAGQIDLFHLHEFRTYQNIVARNVALRHGLPYVLQAHGSVSRRPKKYTKWVFDEAFGQRILRDASGVIALSQAEAQHYLRAGADAGKVSIIPNGIDLEGYATLPARGQFRGRFGIGEGTKIVLYLGRIHVTKGIDFLVRSYALFKSKTRRADTVLVIAGPDDGYLSELKRLIRSLHIDEQVVFTGMLSERDKVSAYVDASVVVYVEPSNVYGLVPLEAAACSRPVIVSNGNAMKTIVLEGGFGYSVEYSDKDELAGVIAKIVYDEELVSALGNSGRKLVFEKYGWARIADEYEKTYARSMEYHRKLA